MDRLRAIDSLLSRGSAADVGRFPPLVDSSAHGVIVARCSPLEFSVLGGHFVLIVADSFVFSSAEDFILASG